MQLRSRSLSKRVMAAVVSALVLWNAAVALADPSIQTDMWIYQDGDTVTVTGVEFGPSETVYLRTTDPDGVQVDEGTSDTDESGSFTYAFTLHATQSGIYDIVATGQSSGLTATTQFDPPPPTPANLRIVDGRFTSPSSGVNLTWNRVESGTNCYFVYRSEAPMTSLAAVTRNQTCTLPGGNAVAAPVQPASGTTVSYLDTSAVSGSDYYYFVTAVKDGNNQGESASSNQVSTNSNSSDPTSWDFGTGASSKQFTVTNTGLGATTFRSITVTGSGASDFAVSAAPAAGTSTPASGSNSFTFTVTFTPSSGTSSAVVNVNTSDPGHTATTIFNTRLIPVTGTAPITPTKSPQTITFNPIADKTYGDAGFIVNPTSSSGLTVSLAETGPCSLSSLTAPATVTIDGAGSCSITASQAGDSAFDPATPVERSFTVAKATLTFVCEDDDRQYGESNPTFTSRIDGLVNGDTGSDAGIVGEGNCTTAATSTSPTGTYAITAANNTLAAGSNYEFGTPTDGTLTIGAATLTLVLDDDSRDYGASDPTFTYSFTGYQNGEGPEVITGTADCTSDSIATSPVGTYTISCTEGDLSADNYIFDVSDTATLTVGTATLTVVADSFSRQYSDPNPLFTYSISGFVNGEDEDDLTTLPTCGTTATSASAVGPYPITCSGGSATNYTFSYTNGILTVTQEDEINVLYTGQEMVFTKDVNTNTAPVILRATVQDPGTDGNPGDVSTATVTFYNMPSGGGAPQPLCSAAVSLVNASDPTVGSASCTWTANIGSSSSVSYNIGIGVSGAYGRTPAIDGAVTVSKPFGTLFLTGGGHIIETNSAGTYAATPGLKTNFGFNQKYNKNKTNLQGNSNIIFRRVVGGAVRTYQIKTNSTDSLVTDTNTGKATFISKANLTDVTDPLAPVLLGGGYTLQVDLTDAGEPGSSDSIAIGLWDGSTLLFSSHWVGSPPKSEKKLLNGGNLRVR